MQRELGRAMPVGAFVRVGARPRFRDGLLVERLVDRHPELAPWFDLGWDHGRAALQNAARASAMHAAVDLPEGGR